jgi:hypothetical protein
MRSLPGTVLIGMTRQKNCNSCVQAKRRCDRLTVCSRCMQKGLLCLYSGDSFDTLADDQLLPLDTSACLTGGMDFCGDEQWTESFSGYSNSMSNPSTLPWCDLQGRSCGVQSELELLNTNSSMELVSTFDKSTLPTSHLAEHINPDQRRPATPADDEIFRSYDNMAGICVSMPPSFCYCD